MQAIVERMNAVIRRVLRCTLAQMNEIKNYLEALKTVERAISSLSSRNTGYSPFFLNFGYHPTLPADLMCGN